MAIFNQIIQNLSIPFVSSYLKIICALINAYKKTSIIGKTAEKMWRVQILTLRDTKN